jgi:hypothetical protein
MADDIEATVAYIAGVLEETEAEPIASIRRIVRRLGVEFANDVLAETQRIETAGGLLTQKRDRRRSAGGVFFYVTRQRLIAAGQRADLHAIFPPRSRPERAPASPTPSPPAGSIVRPVRPRPRNELARQRITEQRQRPANQAAILAVIERHIGRPADLYRRSINPETGEVTLAFYFPPVARDRYATAVAKAAAEAGVPINISPQAHQGALGDMAREVLPDTLIVARIAIHADSETVRVRASGTADEADIGAAQEQFNEHTGWTLEIQLMDPLLG